MIKPMHTPRHLSAAILRLYGVCGIIIAATLLAASLVVWDRRQQTIQSYEREIANLSFALAQETARSMQAIDLVIRDAQERVRAVGIASHEQFASSMSTEDVHRFLIDRLAALPQADGISMVGADGVLINSSRGWPEPRLDFSDRDYYTHFRDHNDPDVFVSAPVHSRITRAWSFFLARRINGPDDEFLGVAVCVINIPYFEEFYRAITLQEGGSVTVFRRDGAMLARYPHVESMMGQRLSTQSEWYSVVARGGGNYRTPGYVDGIARVVSARPVPGYPLAISVTVSETAALGAWRQYAVLVGIGTTGIAICFVILFRALAAGSRKMERQTAALEDAADALHKNEARFRDFALTSSDWFWETDGNHRITYVSEGIRALGQDPSRFIGRSYVENAAPSDRTDKKWKTQTAILARHEAFRDFVFTVESDAQPQLIVSVSGKPFFDAAGCFLGYRGTGRDVTDLKATEAQLKQTQEDLNRAQRLAKVGSDVWDLQTGRVTWSDEAYRIFGVNPDEFVPTSENFLDFVVPEDRPDLLANRTEIVEGKCRPACEFSVRRPDGEVRRIYSEAELVLDENGKPIRWVGMRQDVTEQQRAERRLREAKEAAEAANLAKSQFLANMSHELRTPLNAVIGFSEALELGTAEPLKPKQAEYVGLIRQSGEHLCNIIDDILDLAKVDAGKFELRKKDGIDPNAIVESCLRLVRGHADEASVNLSATIETDLPALVADATRLKQILLNLLSNAIKFTEPGGSIIVAVSRGSDGGVVFEVRDTGIGMSAAEVEVALQPFGQVEATHTRRRQGTGLGLPLAQRLAELHGGSLHVQSKKGHGTTVAVKLPALLGRSCSDEAKDSFAAEWTAA